MGDAYDLERFVHAQERVIASVFEDLRKGSKRGHWMWFVFPQLKGLGHSANSAFYGISGLAEAVDYLGHPVLGPRLLECTRLVNALKGRRAEDVFGEIDALKFRSSMTLFAKAAPENPVFREALEKYFAGELDPVTLRGLEQSL